MASAAAEETAATGSTWAHWRGDQKTNASAPAELAKTQAPFGKPRKAARQGKDRELRGFLRMAHPFQSDHQIANKGGIAPEELPSPTASGKACRVAVGVVFKPIVGSSSERYHWPSSSCQRLGIVIAATFAGNALPVGQPTSDIPADSLARSGSLVDVDLHCSQSHAIGGDEWAEQPVAKAGAIEPRQPIRLDHAG